jgi:uncharacterized repeat protein (TIGR01451 family)
MKLYNKLLVFLFFAIILSNGYAQSGAYRVKNGLKLEYVTVFDDNQFISIKQEDNFPNDDTMHFVISDKNGKVISIKPILSYKNPNPMYLIRTNDNGYLLNLLVDSNQGEAYIKFDKLGNIVWKKKNLFQSSNSPQMYSNSLGQTYLIGWGFTSNSGYISSVSFGRTDICIVKLDKDGNKIWDKFYGGIDDDHCYYSLIANNNKIVILGSSQSDNTGNKKSVRKFQGNNSEAWALEIDSNGFIIKDTMLFSDPSFFSHSFFNFSKTKDNGFISNVIHAGANFNDYEEIVKLDSNYNIVWRKPIIAGYLGKRFVFANDTQSNLILIDDYVNTKIIRIDDFGNTIWSQIVSNENSYIMFNNFYFVGSSFLLHNSALFDTLNGVKFPDSANWIWLEKNKSSISGRVFPDFNADCNFNKPNEYTIPNVIIRNKAENTYAITNDSTYTMYLFQKDTAVLELVNLDAKLYASCGKNNIIIDMKGKVDTTGIDFPIRSSKAGHCMYVISFSSGLLRPGRWGDYQLNYQNNAFDTAYNVYIEIELDMSTIDSIVSPYAFSQIGNILKFNLGHIRPFGFGTISYSIKLKTSVIIGSSQCHRAIIFPYCSLNPSNGYDGSDIKASVKCLGNNTIELELENAGSQNQTQKGRLAIYQDESLMKQDSFKMDKGTSSKFQYQLDDNKVFTAEVYSANAHPVTPILIRHQDLCANKRPIISNNPVVNFYRHDEAKEYEEYCQIVQGSYDPNVKSVQPSGFLSEHYTSTGTELKYRIDFQNTGTDTAFRVVLIDTLSSFLDIASFVSGVSSHPYSVEFGGRAVKFIFDPIALVDSFKNEPLSHGYVCFKIKHKNGIAPKTKIENFVDIYFDYNAPVRTNTVFNTIFDTIQIYVPKGGSAIAENDKTSVIVFPNPSTDKFFIQMSEPVKDLSIEIYDMQGRLIKTASSSNNQTVEVSVEGMTKGIYHIRCMSGEKLIVVKKVMVE